jgi:APA family basic amino acid/polyamine antiporter
MTNRTKFSLATATSLVIANMVGAGVFTSLGFQVESLSSGLALIFLWALGGMIALFGALTYSEAGILYPRCGGEYHYLTKMYHPAIGFLSGWISLVVGFAAPVAATSMALGKYLCGALRLPEALPGALSFIRAQSFVAVTVVVVLTVIHAVNKNIGARFQTVITLFNILFILSIVGLGLAFGKSTHLSFALSRGAVHDIFSPAFAISMFFVSFAYSGWNAAAYVAGEIDRPSRNLPISLIAGTLFVIVMYLLLNFVFLYAVPIAQLKGQEEIGLIFATHVFGNTAGRIMGGIISFLLLASASAMVIAGPRINKVIGEDYHLFRWMGRASRRDTPSIAIAVQGVLSLIYILTSTFKQVVIFIGFTLNLFTFLTVLGVIIVRIKHPELPRPYKTLGYPVVPGLFLLISLWILTYGVIYKTKESLAGITITAIGLLVYWIDKKLRPGDFRPAEDASCPE